MLNSFASIQEQRLLKVLEQLSAGKERYALLDFPAHYNIGDSAIWLGEVALLKRLFGIPPSYVSHSRYPVSEVNRFLGSDGVIYLHGGGNFGDIWPQFQRYREAVIDKYPSHRIIQLPQSIYYRDPRNAATARRVIEKHKDFKLLVRDSESQVFAREFLGCEAILAPDSAYAIPIDLFRRCPSASGVMSLFRADQERRADAKAGQALFSEFPLEDWRRVTVMKKYLQKFETGVLGLASAELAMPLRVARFNSAANGRVAMGILQLDRSQVIVTDRLHGHILSTMLEKMHIVIDNSYGKIQRFINMWGKCDQVFVASDYSAARLMLDSIIKDQKII